MASKKISGRDKKIAERIATDKKNMLEHLRKTPVVLHAMKVSDIGRTTYYDWRKRDPKFAKDADEALREGLRLMNEVAELQLFSLMREKKFEPLRFYLTHRHPAYASKMELSGTFVTKEGPMTAERKALLWKALRHSAMYDKKKRKN